MSALVGRLVRFTNDYSKPDVFGSIVDVAYDQNDGAWVVLILFADKLIARRCDELTIAKPRTTPPTPSEPEESKS